MGIDIWRKLKIWMGCILPLPRLPFEHQRLPFPCRTAGEDGRPAWRARSIKYRFWTMAGGIDVLRNRQKWGLKDWNRCVYPGLSGTIFFIHHKKTGENPIFQCTFKIYKKSWVYHGLSTNFDHDFWQLLCVIPHRDNNIWQTWLHACVSTFILTSSSFIQWIHMDSIGHLPYQIV